MDIRKLLIPFYTIKIFLLTFLWKNNLIARWLRERKHIFRDIHLKIYLITGKERRGTGRGQDRNSEGDENFYLAFTSRFKAAEGPCPKEGRFNIRLWRLCFTVWDTHSAPFRPINPHSAFNLRVFASYSPSHPYTALVEEGRSPWQRRASRRPIVGRLHRVDVGPTRTRRTIIIDGEGRLPRGSVWRCANRWSAVSWDVAGVKSTIEKRRVSPATVRKFIAG